MKTFVCLLGGLMVTFGISAVLLSRPVAAQTCGVSIGIASYPASVLIGSRGTVAFTLDGPNAIVRVQVLLDGAVVGEVLGQELRDMAALRFSVPRSAKTYNLTLATRDGNGCLTTTSAARPVAIVATLEAPPTLTCPTRARVASTDPSTMGLYTPTTSGGVAPVTVACTPPSGTLFAVGSTTNVSCRATDAAGRSTACVFPLTVQAVTPSTTPLGLMCPADRTVTTSTTTGTTTWDIPQPTTGVSPWLTTCNHRSGDAFALGPTVVTCVTSDFNGTPGQCTFAVTVAAAVRIAGDSR